MDGGVRVIVVQNEGVIARIAFAPDRILPFDIIKVESQLVDRYFIHRMRITNLSCLVAMLIPMARQYKRAIQAVTRTKKGKGHEKGNRHRRCFL
jgi:hypothetical protein